MRFPAFGVREGGAREHVLPPRQVQKRFFSVRARPFFLFYYLTTVRETQMPPRLPRNFFLYLLKYSQRLQDRAETKHTTNVTLLLHKGGQLHKIAPSRASAKLLALLEQSRCSYFIFPARWSLTSLSPDMPWNPFGPPPISLFPGKAKENATHEHEPGKTASIRALFSFSGFPATPCVYINEIPLDAEKLPSGHGKQTNTEATRPRRSLASWRLREECNKAILEPRYMFISQVAPF